MWLNVFGAMFGVYNAVDVLGQGAGWMAASGWLVASLLMAVNAAEKALRKRSVA